MLQSSGVNRVAGRSAIQISSIRDIPVGRRIQIAGQVLRGRTLRALPYGDDPFERQFADMERQMAAMERQMTSDLNSFNDVLSRRTQRSLEQARERSLLQQEDGPQPTVRIERHESAGGSRFSYYQSIEIYNEARSGVYNSYAAPPPSLFSPLLFVAMILAGAYAAICTTFSLRYDLTTYSRRWIWTMVPLWPILALFNESFRRQLASVLLGQRVRVSQEEDEKSQQG